MIEAVFISDLHLSSNNPRITERFNLFIQWAAKNVQKVFVLGDLFHAWSGDDLIEPWVEKIAEQFFWLNSQGITLYFMYGNRDFLLGKTFLDLAALKLIQDPTVISLGNQAVLLSHGDRYCIKDTKHQWLRFLTRNRLFARCFLALPSNFRSKIVHKVRKISMSNQKSNEIMDVVPAAAIKQLHKCNADILIHGHTHRVGMHNHIVHGKLYHRYVLSDWDDKPLLMCYDQAVGFYFEQLVETNNV